jgi:hypothetical protein
VGVARGGYGQEAEAYMVERINALPEWTAINLNEKKKKNNPGPDLLATRADGRTVTVSVKSRDGGKDYEISTSFKKYPSDVYAFVNMTGGMPASVYLAGANTIVKLALERNGQYRTDRGLPPGFGSWSPKVSESLLETMGAREAWHLLDKGKPQSWPAARRSLLDQARRDAPKRRG